jgi:hypothetical protein
MIEERRKEGTLVKNPIRGAFVRDYLALNHFIFV